MFSEHHIFSTLLAAIIVASTQSDLVRLQDADLLVADGQPRRAAIIYADVAQRKNCPSRLEQSSDPLFNKEYALAQFFAIEVSLPETKSLLVKDCHLSPEFAASYAPGINQIVARHSRAAFRIFSKAFRSDTTYVPMHPKAPSDQPFGEIFLGIERGISGDYVGAGRFFKQAVRDSDSDSVNLSYFFLAQAQFADGNIASTRFSLAQAIYGRTAASQFPAMTSAARGAAYELQLLRKKPT